MLGAAKEIGSFKNGEYSVSSGITYYGGSPAYILSGGTLAVASGSTTDASADSYIGIFANSNGVDFEGQSSASSVPATIYNSGAFRLTSGTQSSVRGGDPVADGLPYDTTVTWLAGNPLYVGSGGTWTNTAQVSHSTGSSSETSKSRGTVISVGTTYLDVWLGY